MTTTTDQIIADQEKRRRRKRQRRTDTLFYVLPLLAPGAAWTYMAFVLGDHDEAGKLLFLTVAGLSIMAMARSGGELDGWRDGGEFERERRRHLDEYLEQTRAD